MGAEQLGRSIDRTRGGKKVMKYVRVVNVKSHVWGNMGRLDWRQVCALYLGIGELVAHLDGPRTRSGGDIEDVMRRVLLRKRREVVPAVENHLYDFELLFQALIFLEVIRIMVGYIGSVFF